MKEYYEMHITYAGCDGAPTPPIPGWSWSCIQNDIVLGDGYKNYLTSHAPEFTPCLDMVADMEKVAGQLQLRGYTVLRTKIEQVVYDNRRG